MIIGWKTACNGLCRKMTENFLKSCSLRFYI